MVSINISFLRRVRTAAREVRPQTETVCPHIYRYRELRALAFPFVRFQLILVADPPKSGVLDSTRSQSLKAIETDHVCTRRPGSQRPALTNFNRA